MPMDIVHTRACVIYQKMMTKYEKSLMFASNFLIHVAIRMLSKWPTCGSRVDKPEIVAQEYLKKKKELSHRCSSQHNQTET